AALDRGHAACTRLACDRLAVLRAAFDADPHHAAFGPQRLEQRGVEDQRAAVSHAGLDDDVGTQRDDRLLQPNQIFRMLDDRTAEPRESIGVFLVPAGLEPEVRDQFERLFTVEVEAPTVYRERPVCSVDYDAHEPTPPRDGFGAAEDASSNSRSSPSSSEVAACQQKTRWTFAMSATSDGGSSSRCGRAPKRTSSRAWKWSAARSITCRTVMPRPVPTLKSPLACGVANKRPSSSGISVT